MSAQRRGKGFIGQPSHGRLGQRQGNPGRLSGLGNRGSAGPVASLLRDTIVGRCGDGSVCSRASRSLRPLREVRTTARIKQVPIRAHETVAARTAGFFHLQGWFDMELRSRSGIHQAVLALVAVASLALSACDFADQPSVRTDPGNTLTSDSTSHSPEPGAGQRSASCADVTGDGGLADIHEVNLTQNNEGLRVTFVLASPPVSSTGTVLLSITAWSGDADIERQLGMKWVDLAFTAFVFDLTEGRQENVSTQPVIDGNTVTVIFPTANTGELGSPWLWTATTSTDGTDVDECPDPANSQAPARLLFPQ